MSDKGTDLDVRHKLPDRIFHWVMAFSVLVLMGTAFLPIIGIRFDWLIWHWAAGLVLTLSVIFHLWRVLKVHRVMDMVIKRDDFEELRPPFGSGPKSKFNLAQKLYHLGSGSMVLALCVSGLLMLAKIDTFMWDRTPSILSEANWGIVYVVHGIASFIILFLTIVHIYFALVPEHKKFLFSIIKGKGPRFARRD